MLSSLEEKALTCCVTNVSIFLKIYLIHKKLWLFCVFAEYIFHIWEFDFNQKVFVFITTKLAELCDGLIYLNSLQILRGQSVLSPIFNILLFLISHLAGALFSCAENQPIYSLTVPKTVRK